MKDRLFNVFSNMLDKIVEFNYGRIFDDFSYDYFCRNFDDECATELCAIGCKICFGISRVVFIIDGEDWVLKIPFAGSVACEKEVEHYSRAIEAGMEEYFAETFFIGEKVLKDNFVVPMFAMRRYDINIEAVEDSYDAFYNKHYGDDIPTWFDQEYSDIDGSCAAFQMSYGYDATIALESFLEKNHIGDIYEYNIGWNGDCPIIIDYAGGKC